MSLLIYDNKCYLCEKFSRIVRRQSHWTIAVIGHHTEQGISIKSKIFPEGFDANTMFWLVKDKKAYGGRSGLIPLAFNIIKGMFKPLSGNYDYAIDLQCTTKELSCNSPSDFVRRILMLIKNGKKNTIEN